MTEAGTGGSITPDEAVAGGASRLDGHDPGWWQQDREQAIDLETLDVESFFRCVLGQLYGEYGKGMEALWLDCVAEDSEAFGFSSPSASHAPALTAAWVSLITARREAGTGLSG